jgi:tRNA threonylcarbamoyladenosine biosynthesis protein TsaE
MTAPAAPINPWARGKPRRPAPPGGELRMPIALEDEAATLALAATIAGLARPGDAILIEGGLGAGKTVFARGFLRALGIEEEVPSPTFTLVQAYEGTIGPIWHFDLYRLNRPEEVLELGFEEARAEAMLLLEWPDRLGPLRPSDALTVQLRIDCPTSRIAELSGGGDWPQRLARAGLA